MILIGIGSNLAHPPAESPRETAHAALRALPDIGVRVVERSGWYLSEPVPVSDQPWFVNAVARVETSLEPVALLAALLRLEVAFGRLRSVPNAARTLDIDLLDYEARLNDTPALILPHPRLHERRFVLAPLCEIAPGWRHPRLGFSAAELLGQLPPSQPMSRLAE